MTIKGRIIKLEDYLRLKKHGNLCEMVVGILHCLGEGDEEGLKRYPPEIIKIIRERNHCPTKERVKQEIEVTEGDRR
jgi:hypothetical protein